MTNDDKILKMLSNERRFTREKTISKVLEIIENAGFRNSFGGYKLYYIEFERFIKQIKELKGK